MGKKMLRVKVRRRVEPFAPSDLGTEELAARRPSTIESTAGNHRRRRILTQIPLDYYRNMKNGGITQRQWEAGNILFERFSASGLLPSMMPLLGSVRIPTIGGQRNRSSSQQSNYQEYNRLLDKLGRERYGTTLLVNVCCYGFLLADVLDEPYTNTSQLMARFKEALTELANILYVPHYPEANKDQKKKSIAKS